VKNQTISSFPNDENDLEQAVVNGEIELSMLSYISFLKIKVKKEQE
jgi:hypothetical protein